MFMCVKISVVVPVYNLKEYLPRCVKSLINQDIDRYEIILVDDGSFDGSEILCDTYAIEYPKLIKCIHKPNGGLSSARNAGISVAKGKYIIFPDPDDWTDKNYLSCLLDLQEKFCTDLSCTGYYTEYNNHTIKNNINQKLQIMSCREAQKALLVPPSMGGFAWNKLYHLGIIRDNNLLFLDDVGTTEDLDFAFRYIQHCSKICFAPNICTYHYYQRKDAATHSGFSEKKVESIHTYEKILKIVGYDSEIGVAAKEEICNTAINLLDMYLNSDSCNKALYEKIRLYIKEYHLEYIKSKRYGANRKIQAILARYAPKLYQKMKNIIVRDV